jgi:hypothetical protein
MSVMYAKKRAKQPLATPQLAYVHCLCMAVLRLTADRTEMWRVWVSFTLTLKLSGGFDLEISVGA